MSAVAILNIVLGAVYLQYGTMTLLDMKRHWGTLGFTHFGAAWTAMAFTCGPHHLAHGIHLGFEGRAGGTLDLIAVIVGLPAGVAWFLLRVEAFRGGRGDRFISGDPWWLIALPTLAGVYVTALVAPVVSNWSALEFPVVAIPNLLLIAIYMMVGYYVVRTQIANRPSEGGWSVSGLALGVIFPTCAIMHAVWAYYAALGQYHFDAHGFPIDVLSVPAGLYFLWVVRGLYRESIEDWNRETAGPATAAA